MKIFKSRIFLVIITAIICIATTVGATALYNASEIGFTPNDTNWKVNNLEDAINDLYDNKDSFAGYELCSLIPDMTSDTTPSGRVEASSEYPGRPAYNAFSGRTFDLGNGNTFWYTDQTQGETVSYTWDSNVAIGYIAFHRHVRNSLTVEYLKNGEWISIKHFDSISNSDSTVYEEYSLPSVIKTTSLRFKYDVGSEGLLASVKVMGLKKTS